MAFTQKLLTFQFTLASGQFQGGGNSLTVSGLRATAKIIKAGGASMGGMQAAIYGMTLSQMNQLATFGLNVTLMGKNFVTVQAGDSESSMSTVFQGTIKAAWMDAQAMPDVAFRIDAFTGGVESVTPAPPTSVQGNGDVAKSMQAIAKKMGYQFENNKINSKLSNMYFSGSIRQQALEMAKAAGIEWLMDNGTLAIWPAGQARQGSATMVSKDTIMVGYPAFNSKGIVVRTLFDPTLKYGGSIQVKSDITPACGTWIIYTLEYDLACFMPHGPWFCLISAYQSGQSAPVS